MDIRIIPLLFLLSAATVVVDAGAKECQVLVLNLTDSTTEYVKLEENPVTTFVNKELVLTSGDKTYVYPLDEIRSYSFSYMENNAVNAPTQSGGTIYYENDVVTVVNGNEASRIHIYNANGSEIITATLAPYSKNEYYLDQYPGGVYVIRNGNVSIKIIK